ncbi:hypothetical protein CJ672_10275 [Arcobacter cryaerophilus gv. occultus]|uniref:helix-turn-helix transcriptional regulator n=1 Tax=Aliarcobacter cryaerophilus TaxID=28198 RepID=UPI000D01740F|nr:helix-turn-helix domain-containing protein [Aliarcobacter cryaerophilus]PRM91249.1 hypothetical protein CJ672_10275 [Arcobacter cryaerophilus gv. occultus]
MTSKFKTKYRAKELAEYLGIGLSTVWKWSKDGKIKSYVISKGVTVFDINEVLENLGIKDNFLEEIK